MGFRAKEVRDCLQNKFAFDLSPGHADDHVWLELVLPGVRPVLTKVSHGRKEIPKVIRGKIARQLGVNFGFFQEMVSCSKSREDYYSLLRQHQS